MKTFAILLLPIVLTLLIVLLFALMFSYYYLLKRIATQFPKYYKQIGSPFLPTGNRKSIAQTINRDNYNYKFLTSLFSGIPTSFPKDKRLQQLAKQVRLEMFVIISLICFGIGFSLISIALT